MSLDPARPKNVSMKNIPAVETDTLYPGESNLDVSGVCKDVLGSLLYTALHWLNAEPQIAVIPSVSTRSSPITRFSLRAALWPERAAGGTRLKAEL
ncbi:hypothetical protein N7494_008309 [Penicillium frequentans]|uniref:Uncharacterized protein n=1 Tax=Penicillium frequentans TaxID=3151616 RepID=A0AAD6CUR6_9EURO|nr:hypothetical protein N7494_008309 [Penicillium glabrum]